VSSTRAAAFVGPGFEIPREEFVGTSALLALGVHVILIGALVLGVHWQSRAPRVVAVELWQAPPTPAPEPQPAQAEPPPAPPPKPEPRIEKPDIAVKAAPKPKPVPKAEPKPKPKPKPKAVEKAAPKPDDSRAQRLIAEALQREQQALAAERESRQIRDQLALEAQAARERAMFEWIDKIRAKIRGNIRLPPDLKGNPEAMVLVTQLPSGDVLDAKLVISSGSTAYDDAVIRAILKSSPLPKPDTPGLFSRDLQLKFRPRD
jgi:colicin import membrane protein